MNGNFGKRLKPLRKGAADTFEKGVLKPLGKRLKPLKKGGADTFEIGVLKPLGKGWDL